MVLKDLSLGRGRVSLKLVLLDRNAVNSVKQCVSGGKLENNRRRELKKIDNRSNIISPILSVIEGQSGRKENENEIEITLKKESDVVGRFFNKSMTDSKYFGDSERVKEFIKVFGNHTEHSWKYYVSFIKEVGGFIHQPVSISNKMDIENKMFDLASQKNIKCSHPVFVAALATLYGHCGARKVIKPKKNYGSEEERNKAAYNAASDLIVISRIANIRSIARRKSGKNILVTFFTFDKGLLSFSRGVCINWDRAIPSGGVEVNASYDRSLFPDLDDDGWSRVIKKLQSG